MAFIMNAAGGKEGKLKSKNPQCFKWFNKSLLPVEYFSQSKSWMTSKILLIIA